ncbi:GNAT family N-acetyltransferase [Nocardia sp. NPDC057353]|uniref:GNAT family N-acetyltransferase n=1 Tax=Nocardia sp. NPDC057353 TaxID=3346104 RepID=UPI0036272E5C
MGETEIVEVVPKAPELEQITKLAKRYSGTLGMMPVGAFEEAAYRSSLLAALVNGQVVGYALFRLPRNNQVVLSHLCVDSEARKVGVAHALITRIRHDHRSRLGIRAKCRDDYLLGAMWRALGFEARGTAVGRGRDRSPMTVWWLDHGHPDLLSLLTDEKTLIDEPETLEVALDLNILMDLHTRQWTTGAQRSQVLLADHLHGRLRLVVTEGVNRELARHSPEKRRPIETAARRYPHREAAPHAAESLFEQLMSVASGEGMSVQDEGDLWQIAETAAAGIGVLLTWDEAMIQRFRRIRTLVPNLRSFRVLNPDNLVTHLDEVAQAWAYQPARLQGSDFDQFRATADDEHKLLGFLGKHTGEQRTQLRELLRRLARKNVARWLIKAHDEAPIACFASNLDGKVLRVPLLRIAQHPLSETIARQLLWLLRQDARQHGARAIEVSDQHVGKVLARAMTYDAFHEQNDRHYAWVLPVCGSSYQVEQASIEARQLVGAPSGPLLRPGMSAQAASGIERSYWPAKLVDSTLPHFIVPIQPRWSSELLGYPLQLTTRRPELSLGREQVYYRAADKKFTAPARVIWRVSQSKSGTAEIIGTSTLDALAVDTPERLHELFERYGVLDLTALIQLANGKPYLQVLQFSDTELFERPISASEYRALREIHGGPKTFYGPNRISAALFAALYEAGTA